MENETSIKITNSDIYNAMLQHFKDDSVAFKRIDDKFQKNNELAKQNGEHMSHIRVDLTKYNVKIDDLTDIVTKHILAVEPILNTYNDNQATKRTIGRLTSPMVAGILTLASVIGAYYVIVGVFIK